MEVMNPNFNSVSQSGCETSIYQEFSSRLASDFEMKCEDFLQDFKRSMIRQFSDFIAQMFHESMQRIEETERYHRQQAIIPSRYEDALPDHSTEDFVGEMENNISEGTEFINQMTCSTSDSSVVPTASHSFNQEDQYASQSFPSEIVCKGEPSEETISAQFPIDGENNDYWIEGTRKRSGKKTHACPVCRKSFPLLTSLKAHIRIHTGERPFSCPICSMTFTQCSNMNAHMRVHTREKPFPCHICGKAFAKSWNLKVHLRVHEKNDSRQVT